jgi:4-amino-4-deoxy-L-arabinose transferase-like glycosyltransferase
LIGDEPGFDSMARQLLDGHGFTWPGRVPLYPVWLAGVYGISGGSVHAVSYFQSLLGVATIVITFFLGKSIFGPGVGLLASFWVSASYVLVMQPLHLLSEAWYTPVLLLVMLSLTNSFSEPTRNRFFAAGALIGVGNLVRPALLFFPLFLGFLLLFVQERKKIAKYWLGLCVVSLLVVLPWILHNHLKYRAIIPLQTSNAILWQGSPEYYHLIHDRGYTYLRIWKEILYGPGWQQHDPTSIAGDRYWTGRALESILAEPTVYLKFAGEKIFTYWVGDPSADWGNRHIFSYAGLRQIGFSPNAAVQVIFARFLPIVALVALFFLRSKWSELLPLLVMMGYFTLLHAMTHAEARLSEPLQPMLLILTGGAVMTVIDKARERRIAKRSFPISPLAGR